MHWLICHLWCTPMKRAIYSLSGILFFAHLACRCYCTVLNTYTLFTDFHFFAIVTRTKTKLFVLLYAEFSCIAYNTNTHTKTNKKLILKTVVWIILCTCCHFCFFLFCLGGPLSLKMVLYNKCTLCFWIFCGCSVPMCEMFEYQFWTIAIMMALDLFSLSFAVGQKWSN